MKITGLKTFVPGSGWRNLILLRLETDQPGLYGTGEATVQWGDEGMLGYLISLEKRYLLGQDPRDIEALWGAGLWQRILAARLLCLLGAGRRRDSLLGHSRQVLGCAALAFARRQVP